MKLTFLSLKRPPTHLKKPSYGLVVSALLLVTGCQSLPRSSDAATNQQDTVEQQIQDSFGAASQWQNDNASSYQPFDNSGWLLALNDDRLAQYVQTALNNNPDLRASAANLQASIQNARVSGASLWPQLDISLNRNRVQTDNSTNASTNPSTNPSTTPIYSTSYRGSYNISWELDIWGKLNATKQAAILNAETERANYAAAELSLVANVSRAWFNLNALQLRVDIANHRLESQQSTLAVIEDSYKSGLNSALEVYLNRADLASQKAAIIELQDSLEQAIRTFKQLLGEYPSSEMAFDSKLPTLEENVPTGLPSELLERRPDVLASLLQWKASKLNAKAASRARLPSFSLTASYGASSEKLKSLDQQQLLWNLVNNLSLPLFQGGRLAAQAKQAKYLKDASFENYISTLLSSFAEVENSLSSEQSLQKRFAAIKDAAYYSESGYQLALEQYQSGLVNYTTMLESQRRWFDAQSNLISLKNNLLQNRIALYLALGGDFAGTGVSARTSDKKPQSNAAKK